VRDRDRQVLPLRVEIGEVEDLVRYDWAADGEPTLRRVLRCETIDDGLFLWRAGVENIRSGTGAEPPPSRGCVAAAVVPQQAVAVAAEHERLAARGVRAALGDRVDLRADAASEFRVVLRAHHLEFLNRRLREREGRAGAAGVLAKEVVVRRGAVDVVIGR